jgi:hypothetical protein
MRRFLKDADVYIDILDHQGVDALEAAQRQHHFSIISLLQAYPVGHHCDNIF